MTTPSLAILLIFGMLAVVGLVVYLAALNGSQRRKKFDDILLPMGFQRLDSKQEKAIAAARLKFVNPRGPEKRLVINLYRRFTADLNLSTYVCDYHFRSGGGNTQGGHRLLVFLVSPAIDLPHLCVLQIPQGSGVAFRLLLSMLSKLEFPGMTLVKNGNPELDNRFRVYTGDRLGEKFISPRLLTTLTSSANSIGDGPTLETKGDTIVLSLDINQPRLMRENMTANKLQSTILLATKLLEDMKSST